MDLRGVGGAWQGVVSEIVCVNPQAEEVAAATYLMKVVG